MCESSVSPDGNQDLILSGGDTTLRRYTKQENPKDDFNKQY